MDCRPTNRTDGQQRTILPTSSGESTQEDSGMDGAKAFKHKICYYAERSKSLARLHDRYFYVGAIIIVCGLFVASTANTIYLHHLTTIIARENCDLPFGDRILQFEDGYKIQSHGERLLLDRKEQGSRIPAGPCHNVNATDGFLCESEVLLYDAKGNPYYALRLYRDNAKETVLVQGPCCSTGDDKQVHIRTDIKTGRIVIGYGPLPQNKLPGAELYVDGFVHAITLGREESF